MELTDRNSTSNTDLALSCHNLYEVFYAYSTVCDGTHTSPHTCFIISQCSTLHHSLCLKISISSLVQVLIFLNIIKITKGQTKQGRTGQNRNIYPHLAYYCVVQTGCLYLMPAFTSCTPILGYHKDPFGLQDICRNLIGKLFLWKVFIC